MGHVNIRSRLVECVYAATRESFRREVAEIEGDAQSARRRQLGKRGGRDEEGVLICGKGNGACRVQVFRRDGVVQYSARSVRTPSRVAALSATMRALLGEPRLSST